MTWPPENLGRSVSGEFLFRDKKIYQAICEGGETNYLVSQRKG
jgi:hypothetical protein